MTKLRENFVRTIPIMAGYLVLGTGFGIILQNQGYGVLWAFLMSALIYAGSMQYMAINLIAGGAGLVTFALTTLMVNFRHVFYGISMLDKYRDTGKYKPYLIFALTDETYSLACNDDSLDAKDYFLMSLLNQTYWVVGSIIGALVGEAVPFDFAGVEFALTALFVSVVVNQWIENSDHLPAIIGIASSVLCLVICGPQNFLIPSMAVIAAALLILRKFRTGKEDIQ